jgi:hypothetical protein
MGRIRWLKVKRFSFVKNVAMKHPSGWDNVLDANNGVHLWKNL